MQHEGGVQIITFEEHINDVFKLLRGNRIARSKLFKCSKKLIFRDSNVATFFLTRFCEGTDVTPNLGNRSVKMERAMLFESISLFLGEKDLISMLTSFNISLKNVWMSFVFFEE